jgi:cyclopropane-fatty-acyl-phospholipid synthase
VRRRIDQLNPAGRARRNVAHHYDLNGRLYALFLDRDRQYSCAYFARGDETLEEAQAAKKRHIAAKLRLDRPGLEVLDIGCGWGGMAITLARDWGARVTGITLSAEQLAEARRRAAEAGLADRVRFELMDYRDWRRPVDRVVSVGMFEHVGIDHYRRFFRAVRDALRPDGVALVHAIGRSSGPGSTNPWLAKYIFPGGYSPALSEVVPQVEKAGLWITDVEVLRLHYAMTLREWRRRFAANRDAIQSLYDERFCRMFEFYLAGCELAFRRTDHMNWQLQLAREKEALPLTRDYMLEAERGTAPGRRVSA